MNHDDTSTSAKRAYGIQAVQPPLPSEEVHQLCSEFKCGLSVNKEEAARIEQETTQQGDDPTGQWNSLRRPRLTASNFGTICKRRTSTPVTNAVKCLLYKSISSAVSSLRWGCENEDSARKAYLQEMASRGNQVHTKRSGLVISMTHGCLACSPDDWVEDYSSADPNGVVEYKCPYASRELTPIEACSSKTIFCTLNDGQLRLK